MFKAIYIALVKIFFQIYETFLAVAFLLKRVAVLASLHVLLYSKQSQHAGIRAAAFAAGGGRAGGDSHRATATCGFPTGQQASAMSGDSP